MGGSSPSTTGTAAELGVSPEAAVSPNRGSRTDHPSRGPRAGACHTADSGIPDCASGHDQNRGRLRSRRRIPNGLRDRLLLPQVHVCVRAAGNHVVVLASLAHLEVSCGWAIRHHRVGGRTNAVEYHQIDGHPVHGYVRIVSGVGRGVVIRLQRIRESLQIDIAVPGVVPFFWNASSGWIVGLNIERNVIGLSGCICSVGVEGVAGMRSLIAVVVVVAPAAGSGTLEPMWRIHGQHRRRNGYARATPPPPVGPEIAGSGNH